MQSNSTWFFIPQLQGRYLGLYFTLLLPTCARKVNFKKCHLLVYRVTYYSWLVWFWRSAKGIFSPLLFCQSQNLCSSRTLTLDINHNLCFCHFASNPEVLWVWLEAPVTVWANYLYLARCALSEVTPPARGISPDICLRLVLESNTLQQWY